MRNLTVTEEASGTKFFPLYIRCLTTSEQAEDKGREPVIDYWERWGD